MKSVPFSVMNAADLLKNESEVGKKPVMRPVLENIHGNDTVPISMWRIGIVRST